MRRRLRQAIQRHGEHAALHAQRLHCRRHGRRQARGRLGAQARHGLRRRFIGGAGLGNLAFKLLQVARRLQRGQFLPPRFQQRGQLLRRATVAPRQAEPQADTLVQRRQVLRVGLGAPQVGVQAVGRVLRLGDAGFKHIGHGLKLWLDRLQRLQLVQRAGQAGQGCAVVVALQRAGGGLGAVNQGLRVRQAGVALVQLFPFIVGRGQLVQLANLPQQAFALARQVGLVALRLGQRALRLLPRIPRGLCGAQVGTGVAVEQGAHGGGARQALPGVLAVDVHQPLAQLAQLAQGGGRSVDPRAALARRINRAAQQQRFAVVVKTLLDQPRRGGVGRVELGSQIAPRLAFAHPKGIAPAAQHELQRVNQNGFACAGLAGQRGEACFKIQLQRFDNHEVAQAKVPQCHGVRPRLRSSAAFRAACRNSSSPWGAENARANPSAAPRCGRRAAVR